MVKLEQNIKVLQCITGNYHCIIFCFPCMWDIENWDPQIHFFNIWCLKSTMAGLQSLILNFLIMLPNPPSKFNKIPIIIRAFYGYYDKIQWLKHRTFVIRGQQMCICIDGFHVCMCASNSSHEIHMRIFHLPTSNFQFNIKTWELKSTYGTTWSSPSCDFFGITLFTVKPYFINQNQTFTYLLKMPGVSNGW